MDVEDAILLVIPPGATPPNWSALLDDLPDVTCKGTTHKDAVDDPLLSCNSGDSNEHLPLPRAYALGGMRTTRAQTSPASVASKLRTQGAHGGEPAITNTDAGTNRAQLPAHSRT
jgi:hypothetical protein